MILVLGVDLAVWVWMGWRRVEAVRLLYPEVSQGLARTDIQALLDQLINVVVQCGVDG